MENTTLGCMTDYFQIPPNPKQYSGRKRYTLPVKIDEYLIKKLKNITKERSEWTRFSKVIHRQAGDKN